VTRSAVSPRAEVGPLCRADLNRRDLADNFIDELERLRGSMSAELSNQLDAFLARVESGDRRKHLAKLREWLHHFAPVFCWFGELEGQYGYWFQRDYYAEAVQDGEVLVIEAGDEWPEDLGDCEYVAEVTDHGNLTLYARDRAELLSIV
jgi:hypothetical protein